LHKPVVVHDRAHEVSGAGSDWRTHVRVGPVDLTQLYGNLPAGTEVDVFVTQTCILDILTSDYGEAGEMVEKIMKTRQTTAKVSAPKLSVPKVDVASKSGSGGEAECAGKGRKGAGKKRRLYSLQVVSEPISCTDAVVQLPQANSCISTAFPATAVSDTGGVGYTLSPPAPYKPGVTTVTVIPNDGGLACQVKVTVAACPPIVCNDARKQLAYGACDDVAVTSTELWSGGPAGVVVSASPAGPYVPGDTKVKLTPTAPIGLDPCDSTVTIVPCQARCNDRTVTTDPGVCLASSVSIIDLESVGKTALPAPDTTKQTPAAPYQLGDTSTVSVMVNYPNALVSAASDPTCKITVEDKELPRVTAVDNCLYPKGQPHKYSKSTHCFTAPELATIVDNCPDSRVDVQSCRLIGTLPKHLRGKVVPCSVKTNNGQTRLCVSLEYLDHKAPRTIRAVVRGTDGSGNFVDVETTVKIHKTRPKSGGNKSCKLV
jgi:hypothetical protein